MSEDVPPTILTVHTTPTAHTTHAAPTAHLSTHSTHPAIMMKMNSITNKAKLENTMNAKSCRRGFGRNRRHFFARGSAPVGGTCDSRPCRPGTRGVSGSTSRPAGLSRKSVPVVPRLSTYIFCRQAGCNSTLAIPWYICIKADGRGACKLVRRDLM